MFWMNYTCLYIMGLYDVRIAYCVRYCVCVYYGFVTYVSR